MKEALRTSLGCKVASWSSAWVLSMLSRRKRGAWCPLMGKKVLQAKWKGVRGGAVSVPAKKGLEMVALPAKRAKSSAKAVIRL